MRVSERKAFRDHNKFCSRCSKGAGCPDCPGDSQRSGCSRDPACSGSFFYCCRICQTNRAGASGADQSRLFFLVQRF